jgi:hypothetical protein
LSATWFQIGQNAFEHLPHPAAQLFDRSQVASGDSARLEPRPKTSKQTLVSLLNAVAWFAKGGSYLFHRQLPAPSQGEQQAICWLQIGNGPQKSPMHATEGPHGFGSQQFRIGRAPLGWTIGEVT